MSRCSRSRSRRALATALSAWLALLGCALPGPAPAPPAGQPAADLPAAAPAPSARDLEQRPPEAPMPLTPEVRSARLANGFRYYIRRNADPVGRAELRFVVDAGSLLEEEDQRGFAHFLEHMLFNGTQRFPGKGVIAFLQATGMQVGPDANAYTNYDETVCVIKVPTDNPRILPTAFDVMQDWASHVLLDPDEVEAERGVIVEERRERTLSAGGRVSRQLLDLYLAGSRYAERAPIGALEVIQKGSRERLESFYRTWYSPRNLSIVAVGDFDPAAVEAMIRERFAGLQNPPGPPPARPSAALAQGGTVYAVITDPEQPVTRVSVIWKRPGMTYPRVDSYREFLVAQLFDRILNTRLLELTEAQDSPLLQAGVDRGLVVRALELRSATALAPEGKAQQALEALLTEVERVRRHGFGAAELERAVRDVRTRYERAAAEDQHTPSASLADELVRHVTTDEPVLGIRVERAYAERFLPQITLEDLNAEAARFDPSNRVVLAISPEKPGLTPPAQSELAAVVARVEAAQIDPYEENVADGALMPEPPEPAQITSRREIAELGATELVLANGARVLYKPTRLRQQEVLFTAVSPGGASLVSDEDYTAARLAGSVIAESGVSTFSRTDLIKLLAGKDLGVLPRIDPYFESMDGEARSEDLASLFQLIHLYFTAPREDRTAASRVPQELISRLENLQNVPEAVLEEAVAEALYGNTVRAGVLPLEELRSIDAERLFAIYRERFGNAADFTFAFTGSFEPAELEALARRYLGTLPAARTRERYRVQLPPPPSRVVTRTLAQGREQRSLVRMVFEGAFPRPVTAPVRMQAALLEQALGETLHSELRETRGAVYGVGVNVAIAEIPEPTYRATIDFTTDPRRVEELVGVVLERIEVLRQSAPSPLALAISKQTERRRREEALGSNAFWLGVLDRWARFPESDPREVLAFEEQLESVTPEDVRALGELILQRDRYVQVVLQPEVVAGSPAR